MKMLLLQPVFTLLMVCGQAFGLAGAEPSSNPAPGTRPKELQTQRETAMATKDAATPRTGAVLFEFYSSCEPEVKFAYMNNLKDRWQFRPMLKDGNRFFLYHPVGEEIWYEFVVSPNLWYRKDPFNEHVNANHCYLKRDGQPLTCSSNLAVKYVPSEHFDYFTKGDGSKIARLEAEYKRLVEEKLVVFERGLKPVYGKKIRYYGGMFKGAYTTAGNAEIVEGGDFPNSHELIHVLLHEYPHYPPFAEGVAQCFQRMGNQKPLGEGNCSLEAKRKLPRVHLWDVLSDFSKHRDYHFPGSFIYYHIFIKPGAREGFVKFMKALKPGGRLTFDRVLTLYKENTGADMKDAAQSWEDWVRGIDANSNVYVDWQ